MKLSGETSSGGDWRAWVEQLNLPMLLSMVGLLALGFVNLASASRGSPSAYHWSQLVWIGLGTVVFTVVCMVGYRLFERWAYAIYVVVCMLLVAVLVVGTELNGSQRWLDFGLFLMQPSELLKLAVVLVTARYFQDHAQSDAYTLWELGPLLGMVGVAVALVVQQPDLGTSVLILAIFGTMVLFEGLDRTSLVVVVVAGVVAVPVVWNVGMHDYQRDRVKSYLNVTDEEYGASWQVRQSVIAFGSGRWWGKGFGEGTQVHGGFVPEHENDFIAANWGEERGFMGMSVMVALFGMLILSLLDISRRARDVFGAHVGVGVAAIIFWHTIFNLGMVTGMLPVVGLTLPLLSYGGSSLLTVMTALALAAAVEIGG